MRVEVIFSSKHASTREVAAAIAEELAHSHQVLLRDAEEVLDLDDADAVVLGSAIYVGKWLGPARRLIEKHADELRRRPTWLFSVGPLGDPPKPEEPGPVDLEVMLKTIGARGHQTFSGKLDFAAIGRVKRLMVKSLGAPEGDFRDWDEIHEWARSISDELAESAAAHAG